MYKPQQLIYKEVMLYIVPTPIGNLEDITLRALNVLKSVTLIACEDTRTSGKLLNYFNIKTPMISYHKFNESKRTQELITKLIAGDDIAVISDAGTPGISDPSSYLIKEAIANEIKIDVLPGATALIPALVISGLDTTSFTYMGFLPEKNKDKVATLELIKNYPHSMVFYVSPHSLHDTLVDLLKHLGNRKVAIIREISKLFQTVYRDTLEYFVKNFSAITLKGEFVLVVEGAKEVAISEEFILQEAKRRLAEGDSLSIIVKVMSKEFNIKKNNLYKLLLENNIK